MIADTDSKRIVQNTLCHMRSVLHDSAYSVNDNLLFCFGWRSESVFNWLGEVMKGIKNTLVISSDFIEIFKKLLM